MRAVEEGLATEDRSFAVGVDFAAEGCLFGLLLGLRFPFVLASLTLRLGLVILWYFRHKVDKAACLTVACYSIALAWGVAVREREARLDFARRLQNDALHSLDVRGLQNPFSAPNLSAWIRSFVPGHAQQEEEECIRVRGLSAIFNDRSGLGNNTSPIEPVTKRFGVLERWELDYDRLRVVDKIGAGAAGHVWRGEYLGATVAVKQLYSSFMDPSNLDEFSREVTLLHQLKHPHVLTFYGISRRDLYVYIVTEFCPFALDLILKAPAVTDDSSA